MCLNPVTPQPRSVDATPPGLRTWGLGGPRWSVLWALGNDPCFESTRKPEDPRSALLRCP